MPNSAPRKKWDLTQEDFDVLLSWLDPDRERAAQKYEDVRQRLIRIFMHRGCAGAEDLADKTINQVARRAREVKADYEGDPALYFYGVARNIYSEHRRARPETVPVIPEVLQAPPADEPDGSEREHACLESCLAGMSPEHRELLLEYYREERGAKIERHKEMARRRGLTANALRILLCRLRARFKACMRACLDAGAA